MTKWHLACKNLASRGIVLPAGSIKKILDMENDEVDAPMDGDHIAFTKVLTSLLGVISPDALSRTLQQLADDVGIAVVTRVENASWETGTTSNQYEQIPDTTHIILINDGARISVQVKIIFQPIFNWPIAKRLSLNRKQISWENNGVMYHEEFLHDWFRFGKYVESLGHECGDYCHAAAHTCWKSLIARLHERVDGVPMDEHRLDEVAVLVLELVGLLCVDKTPLGDVIVFDQ